MIVLLYIEPYENLFTGCYLRDSLGYGNAVVGFKARKLQKNFGGPSNENILK